MGFLTIFVIFLIAALLAVKWKEDFYDTFPMTVSGLILVMYVFAFFEGLPYVDFVAGGIFLGILIGGFFLKGEKGKLRMKEAGRILISPKSIFLLLTLTGITFLVKDRAALWWDDINYWAVDAKALYYNGGFAGKYGNVAPEFGDYPPALQLFKWFFMHLSTTFSEGLMFGAYYCLNLIYLLPLLGRLQNRWCGRALSKMQNRACGKDTLYLLLGLAALFLLPGIVDGIAKEGTCADVTMGIIYGAFLWAAYEEKEHSKVFYFSRLTLYLCVLVLTKSVGIEWAFFGLVFFALISYKRAKEKGIPAKKLHPYLGLMTGAVLLTEGSWLLFCLLNRRVAKLTGAGIRIATSGDFSFLQNSMEKMKIYLEGFMMHPMHGDDTGIIDLSSGAMLIIFLVAVALFFKWGYLSKWEKNRFLFFVGITAFMAYGIIFLGHITIFAGELQYLDPYVMAKSIARYGAPFTIGLLYLFLGILILHKKNNGYLWVYVIILLTTSLPGAYQTLYGYRATVDSDLAGRSEMVEDNAELFLNRLFYLKAEKDDGDIFRTRTLYLRNDKEIHWVKDTYVSFEASPVPVVYGGIATDTMTEADMVQKIKESHADYLYADKVEGDPAHLFTEMLNGEAFQYETFYEIIEENGSIRLQKLE